MQLTNSVPKNATIKLYFSLAQISLFSRKMMLLKTKKHTNDFFPDRHVAFVELVLLQILNLKIKILTEYGKKSAKNWVKK